MNSKINFILWINTFNGFINKVYKIYLYIYIYVYSLNKFFNLSSKNLVNLRFEILLATTLSIALFIWLISDVTMIRGNSSTFAGLNSRI